MTKRPGRRAAKQASRVSDTQARSVDYSHLKNTLGLQSAFSEDHIAALHETALRVIEELGIRVLHEGARKLLSEAGAQVDETTQMVRIDRALIGQALESAPEEFVMRGSEPAKDVAMGGRNTAFVCVGGPPHVSDLDRGKRNGTLKDCRNMIRLSEHFDVLHLQSPNVEPQDISVALRHLHTVESQVTLSRKPFFIFSRGKGQVRDAFEMTRIARGLSQEAFKNDVWCYTVIKYQLPPPVGYSHVSGHHRFRSCRTGVRNNTVYIGRGDGAGHNARRSGTATC